MTESQFKNHFRYVVPLGEWCIIAEHLKRRGLRTCTFPFDWIFCNLDAVINTISLYDADESPYVWAPQESWPVYPGHPKQVIFHHHDMNLPETRQYYKRCLERMFWVLEQTEPVLFIHAAVDQTKRHVEKLKLVKKILKNKYPNLPFEILSIQETPAEVPQSSVKIYRSEPNIVYADVTSSLAWTGNNWHAPADFTLWNDMFDYFPIEPRQLPAELFSKKG